MKFVLGSPSGRLETLIVDHQGDSKKVTGIKTADGKEHLGELVLIACKSIQTDTCPSVLSITQVAAGLLPSSQKRTELSKQQVARSCTSTYPNRGRTSETNSRRRIVLFGPIEKASLSQTSLWCERRLDADKIASG